MDWFPWYFTLYEADTMHLNPYQDGCYRRLIDHYMKTRQALPDNDAALARIIGDSLENWIALAASMVRPFFTSKEGRLFLYKCEITLSKQDIKTRKLSESGKNGAKKRWNENKDIDSHPIATPMGWLKPTDSIGEEIEKRVDKKEDNKLPELITDRPLVFSESEKTETMKNPKRATRLQPYLDSRTEDVVSQEWGTWALGIGMSAMEINETMHIFCDYWAAAAGQRGVKADWTATWRNWCRKTLKERQQKEQRDGLFREKFTRYKK